IDDENDTVEAPTIGEPQTMAELLAQSEREDALRPLRTGDVVEGMVSSIDGDEVLVDLGGRSAGLISLREVDDELHVGDPIVAFVERPEGPDGPAVLSLRKARRARR